MTAVPKVGHAGLGTPAWISNVYGAEAQFTEWQIVKDRPGSKPP